MYMIVLNHTSSAGINGFDEEAIVVDGDMPSGFDRMPDEVTGFMSRPCAARAASLGKSPYGRCNGRGRDKNAEEIASDIDRYLHTERKRFLLPFGSIAYIEDLGEIGEKND